MPKILALGFLLTAVLAGPADAAQMSVIVLPEHDFRRLERLSRDGAVGLLVPDAGPETSRQRALNALRRGEVRNSLLGSEPAGEVLIEGIQFLPHWRVDGPKIVLGLPPPGIRPNDRRYPIAVIAAGYRVILTSESTRIPGLVSIVDVAPTALGREGKLGSKPDTGPPVLTLQELDRRIDQHGGAKLALLLMSLVLIAFLAVFWRPAVLAAFAAALLANLALGMTSWTYAWGFLVLLILAVASLAFALLPLVAHGFLLAGVLVAYLLAMGIDERWVALSPLGPTQNARFYGLSNLLATLLLVPALAGAVLLARRFGLWAFLGVAALSLVTVAGGSFGADGGGAIVLLVAFAVLAVLDYGFDRRLAIGAGSVAAGLLVALAVGGASHVTDALSDGPVGLAEDLGRRLRLSFERTTNGIGVALLVFGGVV